MFDNGKTRKPLALQVRGLGFQVHFSSGRSLGFSQPNPETLSGGRRQTYSPVHSL